MATATALGLQIARRINDVSQVAISAAGYLDFINMAHDDLTAAGWLQPHNEDVSLSLVTAQYNYTVPTGYAYIQHIYIADANGDFPLSYYVPQHQYRLGISTAGVQQIQFFPDAFDLLVSGRTIKIIGQKRPATGIVGGDTIVPVFVAFARERALSYAAEFLAAGTSELSSYRQKLADNAWAKSNAMLGWQPQETRVKPNSRLVPTG